MRSDATAQGVRDWPVRPSQTQSRSRGTEAQREAQRRADAASPGLKRLMNQREREQGRGFVPAAATPASLCASLRASVPLCPPCSSEALPGRSQRHRRTRPEQLRRCSRCSVRRSGKRRHGRIPPGQRDREATVGSSDLRATHADASTRAYGTDPGATPERPPPARPTGPPPCAYSPRPPTTPTPHEPAAQPATVSAASPTPDHCASGEPMPSGASPCSLRKRSASMAALQPIPAAVIACR